MQLSIKGYAERYGMSRQGAVKYAKRRRWMAADNRVWNSCKDKSGKWVIEEDLNGCGDNPPIERLRLDKLAEEIVMLQQRNHETETRDFQAWCDCLKLACKKAEAKYTENPFRLPDNPNMERELHAAIMEVFGNMSTFLSEEIMDYWEQKR